MSAEPVVWDDPAADWTRFAGIVIRSCWDYHLRLDEFETWTRGLEAAGIPTWNPPELLRWNARKTYLRDLAAAGVPVVPTRLVEGPDVPELAALLRDAGWETAVVKPVVCASAYETWRTGLTRPRATRRGSRTSCGARRSWCSRSSRIERDGEWSLCFFGGEYSHAVLKRPAPGDFRVQADYGGAYVAVAPEHDLLRQAREGVEAVGRPTAYARVDGCLVGGTFQLIELELIEPGLFLGLDAAAPGRFAAVLHALAASRRQE